jgi:hypothetical protein
MKQYPVPSQGIALLSHITNPIDIVPRLGRESGIEVRRCWFHTPTSDLRADQPIQLRSESVPGSSLKGFVWKVGVSYLTARMNPSIGATSTMNCGVATANL